MPLPLTEDFFVPLPLEPAIADRHPLVPGHCLKTSSLPVPGALFRSVSAAACRFLFWVPKTGAISELAACSGPKKGASAAQKARVMLVIIYKPSVTTPAHFHVAYSRYFLRLFAEASEYKPVFEIGIASAGVSSALAVTNTKTNSRSFGCYLSCTQVPH